MPGVTGTAVRVRNLRHAQQTFYDFSTAGGLTIVEGGLGVAAGHAITQTANGVTVKYTSANNGQSAGLKWTPASALNLTSAETFGVEVDWSADPTSASLTLVRVLMAFDTGSTYTNYYDAQKNSGVPHYGRRIIWLNKSDFTTTAAPNWSSIKRVEVYIGRSTRNTAVVPINVNVVGFYVNFRHQTPTLIWTFDDDDLTQFTEAYSGTTNAGISLQAYGWKGTCFINDNTVGTSLHMTLANLQTLYADGWDMCCHGTLHNAVAWQYTPSIVGTTLTMTAPGVVIHDYTTGDTVKVTKMDPIEMIGSFTATVADNTHIACTIPTPEATTNLIGNNYLDFKNTDIASNIASCIAWLQSHGFSRASKHYAYPYGYFSDYAISELQRLGYKTARTLGTMTGALQGYGWSGLTYASNALDWYRLPARGLGSSDNAAAVLANIDDVIKHGGCIILYCHNLVTPTVATRDFDLNTEWPALLQGIRSRELQGLLQVKKYADYYDECIGDAG